MKFTVELQRLQTTLKIAASQLDEIKLNAQAKAKEEFDNQLATNVKSDNFFEQEDLDQ